MERYNYQYNIKIVGVPQTTRFEAAEKTSELCIDLFHKIGATNIIINDIYIAHRIPNHRAINSTAPPAIICKFTRRLARESVMNRKKYTNNVTAQDSKIWPASQIKVSIFDHLTPRQQELLHECKKSQCDHGYKFCWVKKFCNLLALWGRRRCYSHYIKRWSLSPQLLSTYTVFLLISELIMYDKIISSLSDMISKKAAKHLSKELPYYNKNILTSHGQFNNLILQSSLPTKKYL